LLGVMSTAIQRVHAKNGPWVSEGGYEYNLALIAVMVALADVGPGHVSLDHALGIEVKGPVVALLALAAGIGGAAVLTGGGPQATEPAPPPTDTPQPAEATATA
jgi:putative oxidoreductase